MAEVWTPVIQDSHLDSLTVAAQNDSDVCQQVYFPEQRQVILLQRETGDLSIRAPRRLMNWAVAASHPKE